MAYALYNKGKGVRIGKISGITEARRTSGRKLIVWDNTKKGVKKWIRKY